MKIDKIISQHRRDFSATLVCEHCGNKQNMKNGYDDDFYHKNVIPSIACEACGNISPEDYQPQTTKYPDWMQL
jgi:primosomal protein N'